MPTFCDLETVIALNVTAKRGAASRCFPIVDGTIFYNQRRLMLASGLVFCVTKSTLRFMDGCVFGFVLPTHVPVAAEIQIAITNTPSALFFSPRIGGWILNRVPNNRSFLSVILSA